MIHIAVDFETTGLCPGVHAAIEIGAVCVETDQEFSRLILPFLGAQVTADAMCVNRISSLELEQHGSGPVTVFSDFFHWIDSRIPRSGPDEPVLFVGWNAAFDWGFLRHYAGRYGVKDPFHRNPIDIRCLLSGKTGRPVTEIDRSTANEILGISLPKRAAHRALADAREVADMMKAWIRSNEGLKSG